MPADADRARGRGEQAADHLDRRRLARAVGAEEGEQLAGPDRQVEPVDGALRSEQLASRRAARSCGLAPSGLERAVPDRAGAPGPA